MRHTPRVIATKAFSLNVVVPALLTSLDMLQDCISAQGATMGYGSTCQLSPDPDQSTPYLVFSPLLIGRSNIVITGTMLAGPADTVLRRAAPTVSNIMLVESDSITDVTVQYLTFDGNRYGFGTAGQGLSCLKQQFQMIDLKLAVNSPPPVAPLDPFFYSFGNFLVQWVDFINAPDTALVIAGGGFLRLSNFGMAAHGIGPTGAEIQETGEQAATRFTAAYISGNNNGALYNAIYNAGTAGMTLEGSGQTVYSNLIRRNRYEISDGSGGGQLALWRGAANAYVAGNVINGDSWPPQDPSYSLATLCPNVGVQQNGGGEVNGVGHSFYNNEVEQHTGDGIVFKADYPTTSGQITVSSRNPSDGFDTPRYIEGNAGYGGIVFLGPPDSRYTPVQGVTLDAVLSRNNAGWGVYLEGVQNYAGFIGFINGSCMSQNRGNTDPANDAGNVGSDTTTNLTNHIPTCGSANPCYNSINGGACPVTTWSMQTPAPSRISGWPW
jgi:hypothetical protein